MGYDFVARVLIVGTKDVFIYANAYIVVSMRCIKGRHDACVGLSVG
jgi:hypothetical protein